MRTLATRALAVVPVLLAVASAGCSSGCGPSSTGSAREFQPDTQVGGRAVAIAVRPGDAKRMLVASESGGMFSTSDGGKTWSRVSGFPRFGPRDIAFAPGNANVVIATTNADFRVTVTPIWRSTDGGVTWSAVPTGTPIAGSRCTDRPSGHGIGFEPGSSNVFAGTDCGLAVSTDLGAKWTHKVLDASVTVNSGKTQDRVLSAIARKGGQVNVAAASGLWYSTTSGSSWTKSSGPASGLDSVTHAFAASPNYSGHLVHIGRPDASGETASVYLSSDGGAKWVAVWSTPAEENRPPFVRATKAASGAPYFDVYIGDGTTLIRKTWVSIPPSAPCSGGLLPCGETLLPYGTSTQLTVDHADPSDVAFDAAGVPILLATDGGLHVTSDKGTTWKLTGGGKGGYNALQIYDVTGQEVSGSKPHVDLYFGTQDNFIWASQNAGLTWPVSYAPEGFLLRVVATSVDHSGVKVTGRRCAKPCFNFITDAHLASAGTWPEAPLSVGWPPFLIKPGHYIQRASTTKLSGFRLTTDNGKSWKTQWAFTFTEDFAHGAPAIAGPAANPTIYQAVRRSGATADGAGRIGLVRTSNLYQNGQPVPGGATVEAADEGGAISLGYWSSMFSWGTAYGVNPSNPKELIAADMESHMMVHSVDGGTTWDPDNSLTQLVTGNGVFNFQLNFGSGVPMPVVRQIAFDPENHCHILVGTRGNGVIRSADGGKTWHKVSDSDAMGDVSSFYFTAGQQHPVYASTYGRGLWTLDVDRIGPSCSEARLSVRKLPESTLHNWLDGTKTRFAGIHKLPCATCSLVVVKDGQITDVDFEGTQVRRVVISGGSVHQFDARGQRLEVTVANELRGGLGRFGGNSRLLEIVAGRVPIRGLLMDHGAVVGVVTSRSELPNIPGRSPYVRLVGREPTQDATLVRPGDRVTLVGEGFMAPRSGASGLQVRLDDEVIGRDLPVNGEGGFELTFEVRRPVGAYQVIAEQRLGRRVLRDTTMVRVVVRDMFESR